MGIPSLVLALIEFRFPSVVAGHGYDLGNSPGGGARGDDEDGGISTRWILAVLVLGVFTSGLLVGLNPSAAKARLRTFGPKALILIIIAAPLVAWTTASSGREEQSLIVERATGLTGAPELLVSLGEDDLNTLETTRGKRIVRVECVDRDGQIVLDSGQAWPFIDEPGYDYPHAHQPASRKQLQRVESCRLRGTRMGLEADVEGPLPR